VLGDINGKFNSSSLGDRMRKGHTFSHLCPDDPEYTANARHDKVQGTWVLGLVVGADEEPTQMRVQRSVSVGLTMDKEQSGLELDGQAVAPAKEARAMGMS
jgi:hypothetical protein